MKTYRHPETGHVQSVDDNAADQIRALTNAGYAEWDAAAQAKAKEQAAADNAKKLADAQKERDAGPQRPKPLNPNAQTEAVVTEGTILPVGEDTSDVSASKPPKSGTVVAEGTTEPQEPEPPVVPKRK